MISFFLTAVRLLKALRKSFSHPVFKSLLATLFLIVLSGTLFYTKIEGWDVLDAIYFGVVSLIPSGVDTGLSPATNLGKIFTMMYLIVGIGVMIGLIGIIAKAVIDFDSLEEGKRKKK
ncbi:hypothetical protein J2Z40_003663 [Cytobacillus eiseniae]|uniref:Potassium channel domain-containing protein n=1 Tax=Cytobacillus eiseniae TaxID=762947 RepID=A0ABS4RL34_9BACI|nr:potassium channel family protein [Cytobacillus eiseniae]MBP2243075.1 hypothetical protein [Cytobacillus eiseniae]